MVRLCFSHEQEVLELGCLQECGVAFIRCFPHIHFMDKCEDGRHLLQTVDSLALRGCILGAHMHVKVCVHLILCTACACHLCLLTSFALPSSQASFSGRPCSYPASYALASPGPVHLHPVSWEPHPFSHHHTHLCTMHPSPTIVVNPLYKNSMPVLYLSAT